MASRPCGSSITETLCSDLFRETLKVRLDVRKCRVFFNESKLVVYWKHQGAVVALWLDQGACNPQVLGFNTIKVIGDDRKNIQP